MNLETRNWKVETLYLAAFAVILLWSAIAPRDRLTWWLEVAPALIALPILILTFRRFPLTPMLYALIFVHACILVAGGTYTYAEVPLGYWMQDLFHLSRNPYDGIGHFAQGFVPAMIAREVLLRNRVLRRGWWLFGIVLAICLAISAAYELAEWMGAIVLGGEADAFLGTQGDPWDTQKDMALAAIGAIVAQAVLRRWHDRQLARLEPQ